MIRGALRAGMSAAAATLLVVACASQGQGQGPVPGARSGESTRAPERPRDDVETPGSKSNDPTSATLGAPRAGPLAVLREALDDGTDAPSVAPADTRRREMTPPAELWRTRIGITTYRSTIHVVDGAVVVNSNGSSLKSKNDRDDVVWLLDGATGEARGRFAPRGGGERDCNGVALDGDVLAFGTDEGELYAFERDGQLLWRTRLDGDVESAPAFAELDGRPGLDLVVATEGGVVYGIEGRGGRKLWRHASGKGAYGQKGFLASPAVVDVDGDGRVEVFIGGRDGTMRSLDGRDGRVRWELSGRTGMHASPLILDTDGDGRKEVVFSESYGNVYLADADTGRLRWTTKLPIGLMGSMGWYPDARCIMAGTAWFGHDERVYCVGVETGEVRWSWRVDSEKISSGFVVGDLDGAPGAEVAFGTESGLLVALGVDGEPRWTVDLDAPVECTPTLADLDGDARQDVLVAGTDGYLRAYETSGFPPASVAYFRSTPQNTGVF